MENVGVVMLAVGFGIIFGYSLEYGRKINMKTERFLLGAILFIVVNNALRADPANPFFIIVGAAISGMLWGLTK